MKTFFAKEILEDQSVISFNRIIKEICLLSVNLFSDETRETDGASRDAERPLRARIGAESRN